MLASGPDSQVIEELEADDNVRAVVARINSLAVRHGERRRFGPRWRRLAKKSPASFPWASMAASAVTGFVRRPACLRGTTTLTGSIGVFA